MPKLECEIGILQQGHPSSWLAKQSFRLLGNRKNSMNLYSLVRRERLGKMVWRGFDQGPEALELCEKYVPLTYKNVTKYFREEILQTQDILMAEICR